jgi:hypothetical protein
MQDCLSFAFNFLICNALCVCLYFFWLVGVQPSGQVSFRLRGAGGICFAAAPDVLAKAAYNHLRR